MNNPACVVVVEDRPVNANRIGAAWRPEAPQDLREFYGSAKRIWIYAKGDLASDAEARKDLDRWGQPFDDCIHVKDLDTLKSKLEALVEEFLDRGVLIHLDLSLQGVVTNIKDHESSEFIALIRSWIAAEKPVLVHTHSTSLASFQIADVLDGTYHRVLPTGAIGQAGRIAGDNEPIFRILRGAANKWRQEFARNLEIRLWPPGTEGWFRCDGSSPVAHNYDDFVGDSIATDRQDRELEEYLTRCLGLSGQWMADPAGPRCVHSALKSLVGAASVVQGRSGEAKRNLSLGAAAILLASACAKRGLSCETQITWNERAHWSTPSLLSTRQTGEEAKNSILALYRIFDALVELKGSPGTCTVSNVYFEEVLEIDFELGRKNVARAVGLVIDILNGDSSAASSDFAGNLGNFVRQARIANGRLDQRSVLNVFQAENDEDRLKLEFWPVREAGGR